MTDFHDFKGAAEPIEDLDIPRIGYRIKVGEEEIHAVMDVEAAGGAWDSQGRPKMLFEPHRFYKNLLADKLASAVAAGLAYKAWGEQLYPKDSYPRLIEAMRIDETAALKSASWGLGQILGENFATIGFNSPQAMVLAFLDDAETHLDAIVSFVLANHLDDELRSHKWAAFARGYNGAQYAKNAYDKKLADRFAWLSKRADTTWSPPSVVPATATPAPIGHNGGPALTSETAAAPIVVATSAAAPSPVPVPLPANPHPTPMEQASKAVGAGTWTAVVGTAWSAISAFLIATPSIPIQYRDPVLLAGFGTLLTTLASIVGSYRAPQNKLPVQVTAAVR